MAGALGAGVNVPRLSLHKVLPSWGMADRWVAQHWLFSTGFIWTRWTALPRVYGGTGTVWHRAGDQGTHLSAIVAVAFAAAIMPALLVFMSASIH